jgi:Protein of unknown function (DUF1549)/Protein of unknown function (DUF1553)/Planctomycete cytochrome C
VNRSSIGLLGCLWAFSVVAASQAPRAAQRPPAAPTVDYQRDVHPILAARCLTCHSQEKRSGGLSLATYADVLEGGRSGAAIRPGTGAASLLVQRITGEVEPAMPLRLPALGAGEIAVIRSWIDEGARATPASAAARPKWEAPLALERPPVPDTVWPRWSAPLDRFVSAYLATRNSPEPTLVDDAVFARRAYLDIWGLLPPPGDVQAFISDAEPDKRATLVERLLADNDQYAQHWISFWNDLLRNDEGANYYSETASRRSITEWLLAALKSDLRYDEFVKKLLNPVLPQDPEGFLVGVNWRGVVSASQTPAMQAAQNTAQIFLGVNLKCNACHDSFISKWKLKDAYAMASFFSEEAKLQLYRCDVAQDQYAGPAFLFRELDRAAPPSLADRRATAAAIFTDPRNGRLPRTLVNRVWQRLFGRGLVENADEMDGEPWNPALLDWLAIDFVEHGYDIKHLIATIVSSRAYQMPAVARRGEPSRTYVFGGPEIRRLTAEQFADAIASITGDWHVYQPPARAGTTPGAPPPPGLYTREWRVAASALTRALGRPIRDQVYSTRDTQATTLQGLEMVNGETLTHWLHRGARHMLGELASPPDSRFVAPMFARSQTQTPAGQSTTLAPASFDLDVTNATTLWLIVQDTGSTAIDKAEAVWADAAFIGPNGITPLSALAPVDAAGLRAGTGAIDLVGRTVPGVRVKTPSRVLYNVAGKGFTRFRGAAGLEHVEALAQGENLQGRFLIFDTEPDMDRLVPPAPATPLPAAPPLAAIPQVVDRVFWYALGRAPSAAERELAEHALQDPARPGRAQADGLADLLWAIAMKPEFQFIY